MNFKPEPVDALTLPGHQPLLACSEEEGGTGGGLAVVSNSREVRASEAQGGHQKLWVTGSLESTTPDARPGSSQEAATGLPGSVQASEVRRKGWRRGLSHLHQGSRQTHTENININPATSRKQPRGMDTSPTGGSRRCSSAHRVRSCPLVVSRGWSSRQGW